MHQNGIMARPRKHDVSAQRITVTVDGGLLADLRAQAELEGCSLSDVVASRLRGEAIRRKAPAKVDTPDHVHRWGDRSKVTGIRRCKVAGCEALDR